MVSPNKLPIVKSAARHACLQRFSRSGVPSKLPIAKKCGGGEVRFVRMRQRAVEIFQHAFCVGVFRVLLQLRGKAGAHAAGHPALTIQPPRYTASEGSSFFTFSSSILK